MPNTLYSHRASFKSKSQTIAKHGINPVANLQPSSCINMQTSLPTYHTALHVPQARQQKKCSPNSKPSPFEFDANTKENSRRKKNTTQQGRCVEGTVLTCSAKPTTTHEQKQQTPVYMTRKHTGPLKTKGVKCRSLCFPN
jgi:hypothetical protein